MLYPFEEEKNLGALVMLGGDAPGGSGAERIRRLAQGVPPPLLVAADRGADHVAALGLWPDIILGDQDSQAGDYPGVARVDFPAAKNFTDGAAALDYAARETGGLVGVAGALGGRTDHLLGNLLAPLDLAADLRRWLLLGDDFTGAYSIGRCRIQGAPGQMVSLIPLSGQVEGICLEGLAYPLTEETLNLGSSRALSNVLLGETGWIRHKNGILLVIHFDE